MLCPSESTPSSVGTFASPERFLLYKGYESGFNNDLMSLELAVGLAWITGRRLVYYGTGEDEKPSSCCGGRYNFVPEGRRSIIDNRRRPNVFDLLAALPIPVHSQTDFRRIVNGRELETSPCLTHLHESAFCARGLPTAPETVARLTHFAEGRSILIDPPNEVWHLERLNLGYYSRFFFDPLPGLHRIMEGVKISAPYLELAARVARSLRDFGAIHVRLTDFRRFQPRRENDYRTEILHSLRAAFDPADLLVVSTDESESRSFFADILAAFPRHAFLDEFIVREHSADFRNLPFSDETAFGLVCNLVLRHARRFAGTPGSSFTGMIHRSLLRQALSATGSARLTDETATFRFIGSGFDDKPVSFVKAAYVETRDGPYSWNRINLPIPTESKSWYREWPEAVLPVI